MEVLQKLKFIFFITCLQCMFSFLDLLVEMEYTRQLSILDWNDKVIDIDPCLEAIRHSIQLHRQHRLKSRRVINVHLLNHGADGQTAVGHTLKRIFLELLVDNWCRSTAREVLFEIGSGGLVIEDEQEVTKDRKYGGPGFAQYIISKASPIAMIELSQWY